MADFKNTVSDFFATESFATFTAVVFLVAICWFVLVLLSPYFHVASKNIPRLFNARMSVTAACTSAFPGAEVRIEPRFGNNVRLYLSKDDFEHILYPDRDSVVDRIGQAWCENIGQFLLPKVYIYDIRTGEYLASYDCIVERIRTLFQR